MNFRQVWTEKYRPQVIEDVILQDEYKKQFFEMTEIPNNLLFIGTPGIGKTTIAKILAKKFSPNSYLYINASEQGNIDTVRNTISEFISVASLDGSQKIIILDEADGISLVAQQALRSIMEEYLDSTKFILTANYQNKLIEAIRSRCQEFVFSCTEKQVLHKIVNILKAEKIQVDKDQIPNLRVLVKTFYPDIRKTINELQKSCISGSFIFRIEERNDFVIELKDSIKSSANIFDIREKVVESTELFSNDYHFLMRKLYDLYIEDKDPQAILLISEYMYRHSSVLDPEVNFTALIFSLKQYQTNNKK
jgi:replication factor C small subunit